MIRTVAGSPVAEAADDDRERTWLLSDLHVKAGGGEVLDDLGNLLGRAAGHGSQARVLILGDLASPGQHPIILPEHGASIREWIRVLRTLQKDFGDSEGLTVVPAHGSPGSIEIIREQIEYLQDFIAAMEDAHRHGLTLAEARREAAPLRDKYAHYKGNGFERNLEVAYGETGG